MAKNGNSICLLKYLCFLLYLFFQTSCSGFSFLLSTKFPSLLPLQASMKGRLWCGGNQSTTPKLLPNDRKRREAQCNFGDPATMQKASPSGWDIFCWFEAIERMWVIKQTHKWVILHATWQVLAKGPHSETHWMLFCVFQTQCSPFLCLENGQIIRFSTLYYLFQKGLPYTGQSMGVLQPLWSRGSTE